MKENSSNTQKIIKGVSSQTIVTIILAVVEIVSFSIMSRLLSQEDFGYYAAIIAISTVFSAFAESGIGSALIQRKTLNNQYINNAFTLSLIFGLLGAGLLSALSGFLARYVADETMQIPLILFSSTLLFNSLISINISLLHRKLKFFRIGIIRLASLIITTIIAVMLALKGYGYYAILVKAILGSLLILIISHFVVGVKYKLAFNFSIYKNILGFSGWLMASSFFRLLSDQTDRLLMTRLFSLNTLGLYTRPKELITQLSEKFNSIFDSALFPILSSMQDDKEQMRMSYLYALYYMNIVGMLMSFFLLFNSELLIRVFLGEKWLNVNTLFQVLSITSIFLMNGRIGDIFLRSLALTKQQFILRVGQLIASVVFILIGYRWGVTSLAISAMFAYFLLMVIKMFYIAIRIEVSIKKTLFTIASSYKMFFFITPIYIVLYYITPNTWEGNIIKLAVFCVLIFFLFILFPASIGKIYKQEAYVKIMSYINNKILKSK